MKKILLGLFVLGGAAAATMFFTGSFAAAAESRNDASDKQIFVVRRADLPITLTENGTLAAKDSKKVIPQFRSGAKIVWVVEEGKKIKQGELLCKLDTSQMETRVQSLEKELVQYEANLKTAQANVEIQALEAKGKADTAQDALRKAKMEFERYRDGDAPQDGRVLEIDIKDADTEYRRSKKRYQDSQMLFTQKFIKKAKVEEDRIQFERDTVRKEGAELKLRLWKKYTHPMKLRELETAVRNAKRKIATVAKRNTSEKRQKDVAVQGAEKRLARIRKQLKDYRKQLAGMVLKAPCPGILLYGDPRNPWMRSQIKVGQQIWGGNVIFTIPDLRVMLVRIQVHEADIDKVKLGQTARVTMDTYAGLALDGKVTRIAAIATGSSRGGAGAGTVKKFAVEITLTGKVGVALRPGISAKAEIHIDRLEGALFVPLQCVFTEDGKSLLYVRARDGATKKRPVNVGLSNETYVEIKDGLDEGDVVLLYNPDLQVDERDDARPAEQRSGPTDKAVTGESHKGAAVEATATKSQGGE